MCLCVLDTWHTRTAFHSWLFYSILHQNIVERGEQMEMWVRDKDRHSLLVKEWVSHSLRLAERLLCAPGSPVRRRSMSQIMLLPWDHRGTISRISQKKRFTVSEFTTAVCLDFFCNALQIRWSWIVLFLLHTHTTSTRTLQLSPKFWHFPCFLNLQKPNCIREE